jgi:hypothetical protein
MIIDVMVNGEPKSKEKKIFIIKTGYGTVYRIY